MSYRARRPDYWTYASEIMLRDMGDILEAKRIVSADIPKGIHSHLGHFFNLAVEGKDYGLALPKNRKAHFTIYQFLRKLPKFKDITDEAVNAQIEKLCNFHSGLLVDRDLKEEELETVEILIRLYQSLIREGYEDRRVKRGPGCY